MLNYIRTTNIKYKSIILTVPKNSRTFDRNKQFAPCSTYLHLFLIFTELLLWIQVHTTHIYLNTKDNREVYRRINQYQFDVCGTVAVTLNFFL